MPGMSRRPRRALLQLAPLVVVATLVGIAASDTGGGDRRSRQREGLIGAVTIDGGPALRPATALAATGFQRRHPGVRVTVGASGDRSALDAFCAGELDIAAVSRHPTPAERVECESSGTHYIPIELAREGIAVVVSESNTFAGCLSVAQLEAIWRAEDPARSWAQVGPGLPEAELEPVGWKPDSAPHTLLSQALFGVEPRTRDDYEVAGDGPALAATVAASPAAVGYLPLGELRPGMGIRALAIDGGRGCAAPRARTVRDGSYRPLTRRLTLYLNAASLGRPEVRRFVRHYLRHATRIRRALGLAAPRRSPRLHRIFTRR
ncbi:MAG TPA: substrate-binding domain-containing protein [Solirubrobacterales bacterium]|nr:substrate-binding domain-containing protein [Solirubrobacterales bacterium]